MVLNRMVLSSFSNGRLFMKISRNGVLLLLLLIPCSLFSLDYNTTAESVSWNGANSSVADGFEALLYNPAGIYYTDRRFGLNFMGSWTMRAYNNVFSSDDIINMVQKLETSNPDLTNFINGSINKMPDYGLSAGVDLSLMNVLMYMRKDKFALGFGMVPKTSVSMTVGKDFFSTVFQNVNLTTTISVPFHMYVLQYIDTFFALSTRARFLERYIPVDAIYVGMTNHLYIPTAYSNILGKIEIEEGTPDPTLGLSTYNLSVKGNMVAGGNLAVTTPLSMVSALNFEPVTSLLQNGGSIAFGLGWDFGFLIKFNRIIRFGLAFTDVGFMVFPSVAKKRLSIDVSINPTNIGEFANTLPGVFLLELQEGIEQDMTPIFLLPDTAIRTGLGITPINHKRFNFLIAADASISDFHKIVNAGYAVFNFGLGVEFAPKYKWFEMPLRASFNYNSQTNVPSLSTGIGFYFGPIQFEFAVKGLEALIRYWGTREVTIGFDFKTEF